MTAFAEYRLCPYEGESLPVDHVCVAGAPRHAGRGAATPKEYENVTTYLIDAPQAPLTSQGADYVTRRLKGIESEFDTIAVRRDELLREVASMERVLRLLDQEAALLRAELGAAVSLLLPLVDLADDPTPEEELPLEAEAHQAALAKQARGRDPYGPDTIPHLPRFTDHVRMEGDFPSEPRREVAL